MEDNTKTVTLKRFTTVNHIKMIQCGDYNWKILLENDGSEVYTLTLRTDYKDITLFYGAGIFSIRYFTTTYHGGDFFCFAMDFEDTPEMVERLLKGEGATLWPISHKDTVEIKTYE